MPATFLFRMWIMIMYQSWSSMAMNIISNGTAYSLSLLVRLH